MSTIDTMAKHATRPADETHWDWQSAESRALREEQSSVTWDVVLEPDAVAVTPDGVITLDGIHVGYDGFGAVCDAAGAPRGYLANLPVDTAVACLKHGLAGRDPLAKVAYSIDGDMLALTSQRYSREGSVSNLGLVQALHNMAETHDLSAASHFRTASASGTGRSHPLGYLGLGTMAFCLVDYNRPVTFNKRELLRGIICENNMLGSGAARVTTFLFDYVCANFLIWGAEILSEQRVAHIGNASARYRAILDATGASLSLPATSMVETLRSSERILGVDRAAVQQAIYALRNPLLGKKLVGQAYDRAEQSGGYGDPRSAWGIVGGLTELSQEVCTHAADRLALDRAAGSLLVG